MRLVVIVTSVKIISKEKETCSSVSQLMKRQESPVRGVYVSAFGKATGFGIIKNCSPVAFDFVQM